MCLAIPGKVIKIKEFDLAEVEIGGVTKEIGLHLAPEAKVGDYVLVHAGYAIQIIDEQGALETLKLWEELGVIEISE
ncbi:MAG: HypC/HybG/HupF family hydrogenase formation chaperone [Candidatus Subteraquimicrobiales bacterium]|nr:HypC/HybG/HupF family hydrogenase formation chaperone [Candidatus Subteraquimicrobiales bacterium]